MSEGIISRRREPKLSTDYSPSQGQEAQKYSGSRETSSSGSWKQNKSGNDSRKSGPFTGSNTNRENAPVFFHEEPVIDEFVHKPHRIPVVFSPTLNFPFGEQLFPGEITSKYQPGLSWLYYNGIESFERLKANSRGPTKPVKMNMRRKLNEAANRRKEDEITMIAIAESWKRVNERSKLNKKESKNVKMVRRMSSTSTTVPDNVKVSENFTHFTVKFKNTTGSYTGSKQSM